MKKRRKSTKSPNPGTGNYKKLTKWELWWRFDGFYWERGGILMLIDMWNRGMGYSRIGRHFKFTKQYAERVIHRLGLYVPPDERGVPPPRMAAEEGLSLLLNGE
jgi:hypothetical protein